MPALLLVDIDFFWSNSRREKLNMTKNVIKIKCKFDLYPQYIFPGVLIKRW